MKLLFFLGSVLLILFSVTIYGNSELREQFFESDVENQKSLSSTEREIQTESDNCITSKDGFCVLSSESDVETEDECYETDEESVLTSEPVDTEIETKISYSSFSHLGGIDISAIVANYDETDPIFSNVDNSELRNDLIARNYVPQGLTKDNNGNLYLAFYYGPSDSTIYDKKSIIIKLNPDTQQILAIYQVPDDDFDNDPHVGGIAYKQFKKKVYIIRPPYYFYIVKDILFIPDGYYLDDICNIKIYEIENGGLTLIDTKMVYNESLEDKGIHPDGLGISGDYLWIAEYENQQSKPLMGYKIVFNYQTSTDKLSVILGEETFIGNKVFSKYHFNLKVPKSNIQGVYSDSNPNTESRLKFYFSKSGEESFSFLGTVDTKDINNDGKIDGDEYSWESFFSPNGYGAFRPLPHGLEGLTEVNGKLWALNEGATNKYSHWNNSDKNRELLLINDKNSSPSLYPAGSIMFTGTGIDPNFGKKVVMTLAQNSKGEFYYSFGVLNYSSMKIENSTRKGVMSFFESPNSKNPVGYQQSVDGKPVVYVEDLKGVILWNLDEPESEEDGADDWSLSKVEVAFDENSYNKYMNTCFFDDYICNSLSFYPSLYQSKYNNPNLSLGDSSTSDYNGIIMFFNTDHNNGNKYSFKGFNSATTDGLSLYIYNSFEILTQCINRNNNSIDYCIENDLQDFFEANYNNIFCNISDLINPDENVNNIKRLTKISIPNCE
ncbi:hypothetical protein JXR93_11780 [bacterium]|nr:hypothetical protein [bacterium]